MKICPKCSKYAVSAEDLFCGFCGNRLLELRVDPDEVFFYYGSEPRAATRRLVFKNLHGTNAAAVKLAVGKPCDWFSVEPDRFTVEAGDKVDVILTADYGRLFFAEGPGSTARGRSFRQYILVETNQPAFERSRINVVFDRGPTPRFFFGGKELEDCEVNLGAVPVKGERGVELIIEKKGRGELKLAALPSDAGRVMRARRGFDPRAWSAGEAVPLTIYADRLAEGKYNVTFRFRFRGCDAEYPITFSFNAVACPRPVMIPADELDFGAVPEGTRARKLLLLRNEGGGALRGVIRAEDGDGVEVWLPGGAKEYEFNVPPRRTDDVPFDEVPVTVQTRGPAPGSDPAAAVFVDFAAPAAEASRKVPIRLVAEELEEYGGTVGIDFGTSNSCVAYYDKGRKSGVTLAVLDPAEYDEADEGSGDRGKVIPSIAYFPGGQDLGGVVIGAEARELAGRDTAGVVRSVKRLLGTGVSYDIRGEKYGAETLAAKIIRELLERTRDHLRKGPKRVVVTHPANFTSVQIKALRKACAAAGIAEKDLSLIDEPAAAAYYYLNHRYSFDGAAPANGDDGADPFALAPGADVAESKYLLVFDFGGGTLDVSLIEILPPDDRGRREAFVKVSKGDNFLGGDDFDRLLYEHFLARLRDEYFEKVDVAALDMPLDRVYRKYKESDALLVRRRRNALRNLAEEVKIDLSSLEERAVAFDRALEVDAEFNYTREEFEELIGYVVDKALDVVKEVVGLAEVGFSRVDRVLMTGQSSLIPYIRRRLEELMGPERIISPERIRQYVKTCVALGAAIYGEFERLPPAANEVVIQHNRATARYGILTKGAFLEWIPAGTVYPMDEPVVKAVTVPGDHFEIAVAVNTGLNDRMIGNPDVTAVGSLEVRGLANEGEAVDVDLSLRLKEYKELEMGISYQGKPVAVEFQEELYASDIADKVFVY